MKEQIPCDGLEGKKNISQECGGVISKLGGGKNGSKGKSTSNLLVPKQENSSQLKSPKKKKASSNTAVLERKILATL